MASSSSSNTPGRYKTQERIDHLVKLYHEGRITASELAGMAKDIEVRDAEVLASRKKDRSPSPVQILESGISGEHFDDSERMVHEDGNLFEPASPLDELDAGSGRGGGDSDTDSDRRHRDSDEESSTSKRPRSNASSAWCDGEPTTPPPPAPARPFETGDVVLHPTHGSSIFQRIGNVCDFVNNKKARITFEKLKLGCTRKVVPAAAWVEPSDLTLLVELTPQREPPGSRNSPRLQTARAERPSG